MGGHALSVPTARVPRAAYEPLLDRVLGRIAAAGLALRTSGVPAYRQKEDFGDVDVLIAWTPGLAGRQARTRAVLAAFAPRQLVSNPPAPNPPDPQSPGDGITFSFDVEGVQVDLIPTEDAAQAFDAALAYLSWNDLGNFMGRVAHGLGFRYGHRGLRLALRDPAGQWGDEIEVSRHPPSILEFLGYDPARFAAGFDTREEIFAYAASSPHFSPALFAPENLNHVNRTRNRKRQSYREFLEWIEARFDSGPTAPAAPGTPADPEAALERAARHFDRAVIEERAAGVRAGWSARAEASRKFHAGLFTGLSGLALGAAIAGFKGRFSSAADLRAWVLATPQAGIERAVADHLAATAAAGEKARAAWLPSSGTASGHPSGLGV